VCSAATSRTLLRIQLDRGLSGRSGRG
jgi:hypothetical protein